MNDGRPGRFAFKLLRSFCPEQLCEEIEGNLVQKFNIDAKSLGERKARRRLIWNVVRFFRPGIILRNRQGIEFDQLFMVRNYFIIAYRHLAKHKTFSFINITGLAIGMAAFLLIVHYVQFERSYENFHENSEIISRVTLDIYKGSEFVVSDCEMYAPMGQLLKEKFPEVLDFTRLYSVGNRVVKKGTKKFYEHRIYFADPAVFKVFTLTVLHGKAELTTPFQMIVTKSIAQKYFGRANVVGETIDMAGSPFTITAVLSDLPPNTHFKFDFLVSHSTMNKLWGYKDEAFNGNNEYTYLLMTPPMDLTDFNEKLKAYSIELADRIGDDVIVCEPMKDIHLHSNKSFDMETNGSAQSVFFLMIIASFILFIAWINYINLSTARATERAREVGIRKVMGSFRFQLIFQFLSESIIITVAAGVMCLLLFYISLPLFVDLTGQPVSLDIFVIPGFWYWLLGLTVTGSLLAGLYPAFILSSFRPVLVLKGKFISSSHGQWLRKGLVVFQFATTVILIVCLCAVYFQIDYLQKYNLGLSVDQTLVLRAPPIESDSLFKVKARELKNELLLHSSVEMVTQSGTLPGLGLGELSTTGNVLRLGQEKSEKGFLYYINAFDENFIPMFKIDLAAGRNFEGPHGREFGLIINEEAMRALGFQSAEEAVGSEILFYNEDKKIIGVVKNFYQRSPKEKNIPMVFWYDNKADYFSLKVKEGRISEALEMARQTWNKRFPEYPFDYFFLDETYRQQYGPDLQFGRVIAVFCILALLIACLGLFGLSSFTITQRRKEISIRKILGASVGRITRLLSQDFVFLVGIASFIALPIAYLAMNEWLSHYAVRFTLTGWVFVIPMVIILLVAFLTVSFQTIHAAHANPVDSLKYE